MKIIVILNPKGGAGKSTAAVILANTLSYYFDKTVWAISVDTQQTLPNLRKRDLALLANGGLVEEDKPTKTYFPEDEQYDVQGTDGEYLMNNIMPDKEKLAKEGLDYLIIDTPGYVDPYNFIIAREADIILVPVKLSGIDLMDFSSDLVANIKENIFSRGDHYKQRTFWFATEIDKRTSAYKDFIENIDLYAENGLNILQPGILKREDFRYIDTISFPLADDQRIRPAMIDFTTSVLDKINTQ